MLKIDMDSSLERLSTLVYCVQTPDGEMFVTIMEDLNGKLCGIDIKIGKSGSTVVAWAHTLGRILTMAIEKGATINELMTELSMQTSDRLRIISNGLKVRSGAEGVWFALLDYSKDKHEQLKKEMGITGDEDIPKERRGRFRARR